MDDGFDIVVVVVMDLDGVVFGCVLEYEIKVCDFWVVCVLICGVKFLE